MALLVAVTLALCLLCGVGGAPVETIPQPSNAESDDSGIVGTLLQIVDKIPVLKDALEKSGFTIDEIKFLFGDQNVLGDLIKDVYKLSPLAGRLMDKTAKSNVLLRIVLALAKGKTPSIFDLFKLTSITSENMFNAVDNVAATDPFAQSILAQAKQPHPNISHIFSEITGRTYSNVDVLDNGKYSVGSTANRKNRHLVELFKFVGLNWRNLERIGRTFANFPPNYEKMLHIVCSLDFSPLQFAMGTAPVANGKKYQVTNNKNKNKYTFGDLPEKKVDAVADADIITLLHEVRVDYPKMLDSIDGRGGMNEARDAIFHLIEETREIMNRLLDDSDAPPSTNPKHSIST